MQHCDWTAYQLDPFALAEGATVTTGTLVGSALQGPGDPKRCLEVLVKAISNVLANPNQLRFMELSKASATFQQTIGQNEACAMLLRRCGFQDRGHCYQLQRTGLRWGELGRLIMALLNATPYADLANDLAAKAGFPVRATVPRSSLDAQPAGRPGWLRYESTDVDAGDDAYQMPADDLQACMTVAEEACFGGFTIFRGIAYFREPSGAELKQRLQQVLEASVQCTLYIYEPPAQQPSFQVSPAAASSSCSSQSHVNVGLDEEEAALQEAIRLSMMSD
eukprot:TRINITY_DN91606_c0_g1_i1.p1 TRINITY_DN91606_c0_g1~~TRINITY_DN91606_c0_g1_i1.p1  ORF type:complete len:278 (+),score=65.24 TRINITY_DN91606_c0_g1_i1:23-856(+)